MPNIFLLYVNTHANSEVFNKIITAVKYMKKSVQTVITHTSDKQHIQFKSN